MKRVGGSWAIPPPHSACSTLSPAWAPPPSSSPKPTSISSCSGQDLPNGRLHRLMPAMVRTAAIRKPCQTPEGETIMAGENPIVETHPGRLMTPEQLEGLGLLAPPEPVKTPPLKFTGRERNRSGRERQWPSYEMSLAGAPQGQEGPDRSRADFWGPTSPCSGDGAPRTQRRNSWR